MVDRLIQRHDRQLFGLGHLGPIRHLGRCAYGGFCVTRTEGTVPRRILPSVAAGREIRVKSFRSIARVAELADALDLGSSPARGGSSSLPSRISAPLEVC